jgi:hypothetical protein
MVRSSRKIQPRSKRLDSPELDAQATQFEERFQKLAENFRAAQLRYQAAHTFYRAMNQECLWLQQVVNTKQKVIEQLLPYYPHPLTPEMLYDIELY